MDFEDRQEQRIRRQQQFWAQEAEQALDDVEEPVAETLAAVNRLQEALDVSKAGGHTPSTKDILSVAATAAEAKTLLTDIVRSLGGAAVLLNEPTPTVASACKTSASTVMRWSGRSGDAGRLPHTQADAAAASADDDRTTTSAHHQNLEES